MHREINGNNNGNGHYGDHNGNGYYRGKRGGGGGHNMGPVPVIIQSSGKDIGTACDAITVITSIREDGRIRQKGSNGRISVSESQRCMVGLAIPGQFHV